jgi:hypothetical protein
LPGYTPRHWVLISSPSTTRRATVEIFDTAKTKFKVTLQLTVSQAVSLSVKPHLGLITTYLLLFDSYGLVFVGALSDERMGPSFVYAALIMTNINSLNTEFLVIIKQKLTSHLIRSMIGFCYKRLLVKSV